MNEQKEDIWDMSSWRKDIPQKVAFFERHFKAFECPEDSRHVLRLLERYFQGYLPGTPPKPALFQAAFIGNMVENYILHCASSAEVALSAIQELSLLEVLCSWFQDQSSGVVRCAMFDLIFGFTSPENKESKLERRVDILSKLVSMAVALQCNNILDCTAVWMQRHSHMCDVVLKVALHLVEDYISLVPASVPYLESVAGQSPMLACQLMIAFTTIFFIKNSGNRGYLLPHSTAEPSLELLKVVVTWIRDNSDICLAMPPANLVALPSLLRSEPESNISGLPARPVLGLVRWTCLMPLLSSEKSQMQNDHAGKAKILHSQLHLSILQTFLAAGGDPKKNLQEELEPGEVEDEVDMENLINGEELKDLATDMLDLIANLKNGTMGDSDVIEDQVQLALDRFTQVNQVALSTGCLSCRKEQLLTIHRLLPPNKLLMEVMESLNTS